MPHPDHVECPYFAKSVDGFFLDMQCEHGYSSEGPFYTNAFLQKVIRDAGDDYDNLKAGYAKLDQLVEKLRTKK